MSELFTLSGSRTGTGDVTLRGDLLYGETVIFRIPRGMKAKVWCKRITGTAVGSIEVMYSPDVTVPTPAWTSMVREYLGAAGEIHIEKRRPAVMRGITGKEGFKASVTSGTGTYSIDLEVELEE